MPAFSVAQYEATVAAVVSGGQTLSQKIAELPAAANGILGSILVPGFIKDSVSWLVEKACAVGRWVLDTITELLKGAAAPVRMFYDAWRWMDVRSVCSGVAGVLKDTNLTVDDAWKGTARDAYVRHMKTQSEAATRCGQIADKTAISLAACGAAGLAFYVALGIILSKMIAEFIAGIIAVGTGVFSAAGALVIIADSGVTAAMIWGAVGALTALLGAQATQMVVMHGEATDGNFFPGGRWPSPGTENFSDATAKDGDTDWYIKDLRTG